jgi:DNA-binding NarL/FixJ family response regulator
MYQTRVLIVDDHPAVRQGIQMFLDTVPSIQIVGEAEDGQDAICKAESLQPDVVLMDLKLPWLDGISAIAGIKRYSSKIKIIVLTIFGDEFSVRAAIEAGADGYVLKDADANALLHAIQVVQQGGKSIHPHVAEHLVTSITPN